MLTGANFGFAVNADDDAVKILRAEVWAAVRMTKCLRVSRVGARMNSTPGFVIGAAIVDAPEVYPNGN